MTWMHDTTIGRLVALAAFFAWHQWTSRRKRRIQHVPKARAQA